MAELSVDASYTGIAYVEGAATWADLMAGTGALAGEQTGTAWWLGQNGSGYGEEWFLAFDTSSITAGSTINSVTFTWGCAGEDDGDTIELYAYDFGTLTGADWRTGTSTGWLDTQFDAGNRCAHFTMVGWDEVVQETFTVNATPMAAAIVPEGTTRFVAVDAGFRSDTVAGARTQWYPSDYATASLRPHLTIDYDPPAGFTGLTVTRTLNG